MAFIQAGFYSPILGRQTSMNLLVPEKGNGPFAVLYLLHGLSDDHTIWARHTRLECYVAGLPLIVAMPNGDRSFYTDHAEGPAYGRYMIEDVIGFVERSFNVKKTRAARCIGGLSMGGYGAIRLALANPDVFMSAHSHSGALEAWTMDTSDSEEVTAERERIFGHKPSGSAHDIVHLYKVLKKNGKPVPQLKIDCGHDDFLLQHNRNVHAEFKKIGMPHEYAEHPGNHNWDYWDLHIREAIAFHCKALKLKK